jgi:hypothetical protein
VAADPDFTDTGSPDGVISLRATGWGRVPTAAFLTVWLSFWVVGEVMVAGLLGVGAWSLLTGHAPAAGHAPLEPAPALAVGLFLALWLVFWTFGGLAALHELARLLWGHDRMRAGPDGLEVTHFAGPFRGRTRIVRGDVRSIVVRGGGSEALVALTGTRTVELSRLGSRAEREAAVATLTRALQLTTDAAAPSSDRLPDGWEEAPTPEGVPALMPDRARRAKQARVAGIVAFALASVALIAIQAATHKPALWGLSASLAAATAACGWGALWLARGRDEWRLGSGQMVLQRRFGDGVKERFVARRLELTSSRDSDGDTTYELMALSAEATPGTPTDWRAAAALAKQRRRIHGVLHDEVPPRQLGEWLARRTGMPFEDRTTPDARRADLTRLREQLRASGNLGRFVDGLIEGADRTQPPGD